VKKVVWSETSIEGGKPFAGALPHPPTVTGPFQNIPLFDFLAAISGRASTPPTFYADTAVIAYRAPASDVPVSSLQPKITSSGGNLDLAVLTDGDLAKTTQLPKPPAEKQAWIQYEFSGPQTMNAVILVLNDLGAAAANMFGEALSIADVEASDDGQTFRKLIIIGDRQPNVTKTYTFTSPKYYNADSKLVPSGLLGPVQDHPIDIPVNKVVALATLRFRRSPQHHGNAE